MSDKLPPDSPHPTDTPRTALLLIARNPGNPETAPLEQTYRQETRDIRRIAFILNPASAKGHARKTARVARKVLHKRGLEIVDFPCDTAAQARESARQAVADSTVDAIVVSGGDGILSLVLQEQVGSDKPLGIIPAGSGNDHARHLGIPLNPRKSAGIIADGFVSQTDLGLATLPICTARYSSLVVHHNLCRIRPNGGR
ncbi:diacylglycerol/lipid kinase family protein [Mobiluncus curtisii]|uniref:Diacylglycerol kinase n=1 Tax=Mobiluncus curtisii TaxID=2051 RepID=A0A2X3BD25_9ACTO|nr:diacylglycerol kinase family protein [Mobiluncus curtisii]SQC01532.1 Diacylglycerol kinase [Mobiluncus curtisii]